ncbi:hypothetical protein GAMM_120033 [Gammaproteobacteria bacterium]
MKRGWVKAKLADFKNKLSPDKKVVKGLQTTTKERYLDFDPTFLKEKLFKNYNIKVSRETLRKWFMAENIWIAKGRRK